jgi:hypothetical protein
VKADDNLPNCNKK